VTVPVRISRSAAGSFLLGLVCLGCGVLALVSGLYPALFAVALLAVGSAYLAVRALLYADRGRGSLHGKSLAVLGIVATTSGLVTGGMLPTTEWTTEAARQRTAENELQKVYLAMCCYFAAHRNLPPPILRDKYGKPLHSWRVLLLPYLGEESLYKEFVLDEPWDSPHNYPLLAKMPEVYQCPGAATSQPYATFYQVFDGWDTPFMPKMGGVHLPPSPGDGNGPVILVVEPGEAVPWSKPVDLPYSHDSPLPDLGGVFRGGTRYSGYGKLDGFHALLADGTVRFIPRRILGEHEVYIRPLIAPFGEGPDW
jgi:hypothetical protein